MYQNILLATDGSEIATAGAHHGIALAKSLGAKVTVLTVTEPFYGLNPNLPASEQPERVHVQKWDSLATLAALADAAKSAGVSCETLHVEHGPPYLSIIETAQAKNCNLIVMGSHGRGAGKALFLGSHTLKVLSHSKIPVLVCR